MRRRDGGCRRLPTRAQLHLATERLWENVRTFLPTPTQLRLQQKKKSLARTGRRWCSAHTTRQPERARVSLTASLARGDHLGVWEKGRWRALAPSCPWLLQPHANKAPVNSSSTEWTNPHATNATLAAKLALCWGQTGTKCGGGMSSTSRRRPSALLRVCNHGEAATAGNHGNRRVCRKPYDTYT